MHDTVGARPLERFISILQHRSDARIRQSFAGGEHFSQCGPLYALGHDGERLLSQPNSFDHPRQTPMIEAREYLDIGRKVRQGVVVAALRADHGDHDVRAVSTTPSEIAMAVGRLAQLAHGLVLPVERARARRALLFTHRSTPAAD
jgi:hypothetical protein